MKVTATDLKTRTSECLEKARKEPVEIEKNGKLVAVLINSDQYEHLQKLENAYWLARANEAEKTGFVGVEATAEFIQSILTKHAEA